MDTSHVFSIHGVEVVIKNSSILNILSKVVDFQVTTPRSFREKKSILVANTKHLHDAMTIALKDAGFQVRSICHSTFNEVGWKMDSWWKLDLRLCVFGVSTTQYQSHEMDWYDGILSALVRTGI